MKLGHFFAVSPADAPVHLFVRALGGTLPIVGPARPWPAVTSRWLGLVTLNESPVIWGQCLGLSLYKSNLIIFGLKMLCEGCETFQFGKALWGSHSKVLLALSDFHALGYTLAMAFDSTVRYENKSECTFLPT